MRRKAGNVEIDRHDLISAIVNFGMVGPGTAGNRADADDNHDLRRRHRFVGDFQGPAHVFADRPGHQQCIGMPWRSDEMDAEPQHVEHDGSQHVRIGLAGAAPSRADLPQPHRAAEQLQHLFFQRLS